MHDATDAMAKSPLNTGGLPDQLAFCVTDYLAHLWVKVKLLPTREIIMIGSFNGDGPEKMH
jgi:hypothetical protein